MRVLLSGRIRADLRQKEVRQEEFWGFLRHCWRLFEYMAVHLRHSESDLRRAPGGRKADNMSVRLTCEQPGLAQSPCFVCAGSEFGSLPEARETSARLVPELRSHSHKCFPPLRVAQTRRASSVLRAVTKRRKRSLLDRSPSQSPRTLPGIGDPLHRARSCSANA